MKLAYFIFLLAPVSTLHAQDNTVFAPPGAIWYYSTWTIAPPPDLFTFVSNGDTLINGNIAVILRFYHSESGQLQAVDSLNKYVFTAGNQVYYWVEDGFYLLYDFGAQPGDTIHSRVENFPVFMGCASDFTNGSFDFNYVIDSVGSVMVDGEVLRIQHVTSIYTNDGPNWTMDSPIVERIGQYSYSALWWGRGYGCILSGFPGNLRCYQDQDIYFKNPFDPFDLECDYINDVALISENIQPIYPNPTNDFITLPAIAEIITIYNSTGQKINIYKKKDKIDVSNLHPDIYLIRYKIEDIWHVEIFITV